jgi:hypothetical protein
MRAGYLVIMCLNRNAQLRGAKQRNAATTLLLAVKLSSIGAERSLLSPSLPHTPNPRD